VHHLFLDHERILHLRSLWHDARGQVGSYLVEEIWELLDFFDRVQVIGWKKNRLPCPTCRECLGIPTSFAICPKIGVFVGMFFVTLRWKWIGDCTVCRYTSIGYWSDSFIDLPGDQSLAELSRTICLTAAWNSALSMIVGNCRDWLVSNESTTTNDHVFPDFDQYHMLLCSYVLFFLFFWICVYYVTLEQRSWYSIWIK
jgi:hypothetical protein